jgi:hypothetical protein
MGYWAIILACASMGASIAAIVLASRALMLLRLMSRPSDGAKVNEAMRRFMAGLERS